MHVRTGHTRLPHSLQPWRDGAVRVAAREAEHQKEQRRQQRQRRQQALRAPPEVMLRGLLADWGAPSVQSLRLEERHRLAAGLAAAVSALLAEQPPPPPGLRRPDAPAAAPSASRP